VAHACNPSYSGDRDQEDHVCSQSRQIVPETLFWKYVYFSDNVSRFCPCWPWTEIYLHLPNIWNYKHLAWSWSINRREAR
jgi:hypothetical protein